MPLEPFDQLWNAVTKDGKDGAFGVRRKRHDPTLRLMLTKLIRFSLGVFFGCSIYDANVPYKLLKRSIWQEVKPMVPADTLAPSLFVAVYCERAGYDIAYVDIPHKERETGEVSIKRWKLLKFCWKAFWQMMAFRGRIRRIKSR